MSLNTGRSKVYELGFREEKYITATHACIVSLPYVPMDISGLSSILNQTSLPLGRRKRNSIFITHLDAQLFSHLINLYRVQLPSTGGLIAGTANNDCMENFI